MKEPRWLRIMIDILAYGLAGWMVKYSIGWLYPLTLIIPWPGPIIMMALLIILGWHISKRIREDVHEFFLDLYHRGLRGKVATIALIFEWLLGVITLWLLELRQVYISLLPLKA